MNKKNVISISLLRNGKGIFDFTFRYPEEADTALQFARLLMDRGCRLKISMKNGNFQGISNRMKEERLNLQFNPVTDADFLEPVSSCTFMKSDYADAAEYIKQLIISGNHVIMTHG